MGTQGQWELLRGFTNVLPNSIQFPVLRGCRVVLGRCRGQPTFHAIRFFLKPLTPPLLRSPSSSCASAAWQGPSVSPEFITLFVHS